MTPEQLRLVRESFEGIRPTMPSVLLLFYGRLFELDPSLRPLFRHDLKLQTRKLADMLSAILDTADRFDEIRPRLGELGRRHRVEYGVKPEHYETLKTALVWALGHAMAGQFYPDVKAAWIAVI